MNTYIYIYIYAFLGYTPFFSLLRTCFPPTATLITHTLSFKVHILFWLTIYLALLHPLISAILILLEVYGGFQTEWKSKSRPRLFLNHKKGESNPLKSHQ